MSFEDKTNRTLGMKSQEILQRQEDGEIATYWVKSAEWPSAKSAAEINGESYTAAQESRWVLPGWQVGHTLLFRDWAPEKQLQQ